jgi:hypothetical protein
MHLRRLLVSAVACCASLSFAIAPATQRAVNNLSGAIANVQLLPALRNGPIAPADFQTAKNLLRDLDSVLARGDRQLGGIPEEDKADPQVAEIVKQLAEFKAFRDDLKKALDGGEASSAANDAKFRAFREETKPYAQVVSAFRNGAHGNLSDVKAAVGQLAKLDELCRTKYPGITDDPKLSFALNIEPGTWCRIAAERQQIMDTSVKNAIAGSLDRIVAQVEEDRAKLAQREGLIAEDGPSYKLLLDRKKGKDELAARLKPAMESVGQSIGPDTFKPLDEKLDAFAAEIDRLAPTWPFDATHHDAAIEAGAKKAFASQYPGRSAVKTGMLFAQATIDKNALGVPTERYRTGAILAKGAGKWCEYRQFTAHETYSGGGGYAAPRFTFGAMRLQKCQ